MSCAQQTPTDRSMAAGAQKGISASPGTASDTSGGGSGSFQRRRRRSPEHDLTSGHAPRPIRPSRFGNQKPLRSVRRPAAISLTLSRVRGGRPDQYCVLPAASLLGRRPQALACRSGVKQYSMGYRKARFGGLEVHDHLEFCRKPHREIARLRAAQNAIDISGGTTNGVCQVVSVGGKPPSLA